MARSRNIKPGFFTNDTLAEIPAIGRLLFIGLWTLADCRGILEDRPRKIKAEVLPYDDVDVDALLNDLEQRGFIERYQAGDIRCIFVRNFTKHQNPHVNERANSLPAPDEYGASSVQAPEQHESDRDDSLLMIPDSLVLNPETTIRARARKASPSEPFAALIALCEATNADVGDLSEPVKAKQLRKAQHLLASGMTVADIGRLAGYLASQDWRTSPVDLFTVEKERGKWELAGKPEREIIKRNGNSRASPSNYEQSAAAIDRVFSKRGAGPSGDIIETTGVIR